MPLDSPLVTLGERIGKTLRYSRDDIAHFARLTHDDNPLHHDTAAAQRAGYPGVIAAGQHTSSIMTGMVATHFSRSDDGVRREMLCLNFNFSYKQPVFADQDLVLSWRVAAIETNQKLGGLLVHLDGVAVVPPSRPAVIGRGTILVKPVAPEGDEATPPQPATSDAAL